MKLREAVGVTVMACIGLYFAFLTYSHLDKSPLWMWETYGLQYIAGVFVILGITLLTAHFGKRK